MKIGEVLELTKTMPIATIAKDHLSIGEKKVRAILKEIGATNQAGKKGWIYPLADDYVLGQSIYDFAKPTAQNKRTSKRKNTTTKVQKINITKEQVNQQTKEQTKEATKEATHIMRKRASFDIDINLLKELKIFAIKEDKNVYEVVEEAIKKHIRGE